MVPQIVSPKYVATISTTCLALLVNYLFIYLLKKMRFGGFNFPEFQTYKKQVLTQSTPFVVHL
jgi:hypothetical protein